VDHETGKRIGTCPASSAEIHALAFSPDGRKIVYDGDNETVTVCDFEAGTAIRSLRGHDESVSALAFSADGRESALRG
jgi:WD40 repeat protein